MGRLAKEIKPVVPREEVVNLLFAILSFASFHAVAGKDRTPNDVAPIMRRAIYALLGLPVTRARAVRKAAK